MRSRVATCLLLAGASISATPCLWAQAVEHQLKIELAPERGFLRVADEISLDSLTPDQGVEFLLNAALEIVESRPAVERVPVGEVAGFYGINGTSIELAGDIELARYRLLEAPEDGVLEISYGGQFDFGLSAQTGGVHPRFPRDGGHHQRGRGLPGRKWLLVPELWRSATGLRNGGRYPGGLACHQPGQRHVTG